MAVVVGYRRVPRSMRWFNAPSAPPAFRQRGRKALSFNTGIAFSFRSIGLYRQPESVAYPRLSRRSCVEGIQGRAAGLEQADKRRMTVDFNLEGAEVHVVSPAPTDSGQALSAISSDGVVRRAISSCASISETSRKSFLNHARMNAPNSASEPNHVLRIATPRPTFEAQDS